MAENSQLLEQRVGKHQDKLKEAAAVVTMTRNRHADAAKTHKETERALRTLESALVKTEKKAKRLKSRRRTHDGWPPPQTVTVVMREQN